MGCSHQLNYIISPDSGRLGAAMRAARRRAAGAQALLTEHVENVWLTGYR